MDGGEDADTTSDITDGSPSEDEEETDVNDSDSEEDIVEHYDSDDDVEERYHSDEDDKVDAVDGDSAHGLFIQRHTEGGRAFAFFPTIEQFHAMCWAPDTKPSGRNYFESVPGQWIQKPHFDVDVKVTNSTSVDQLPEPEPAREGTDGIPQPRVLTKGNGSDTSLAISHRASHLILDDLIGAIIGYVTGVLGGSDAFDVQRDIRVYTSHGTGKASYHVILPNHYHCNHHEARRFHALVVSRMDPRYAKYVDPKVYSSFQQFRALGSTKHGLVAPRTKVQLPMARLGGASGQVVRWCPDEYGQPDNTPTMEALCDSLITCVDTNRSQWLPVDLLEGSDLSTQGLLAEQYGYGQGTGGSGGAHGEAVILSDMDPAIAQRVRNALTEAIGSLPSWYVYVGPSYAGDDSMHRIERVGAGYCEACDRVHGTDSKGDNAFISIDLKGNRGLDTTGAIHLRCHRNPVKGMLLATVELPSVAAALGLGNRVMPWDEEWVDEECDVGTIESSAGTEVGEDEGSGGSNSAPSIVPTTITPKQESSPTIVPTVLGMGDDEYVIPTVHMPKTGLRSVGELNDDLLLSLLPAATMYTRERPTRGVTRGGRGKGRGGKGRGGKVGNSDRDGKVSDPPKNPDSALEDGGGTGAAAGSSSYKSRVSSRGGRRKEDPDAYLMRLLGY